MEHNALLDPAYNDESKPSPMEKLTHIELTDIQCQDVKPRVFDTASSVIIQTDSIETSYGNIQVAMQGDRAKPAIFTFHDIGLNHQTCYQGFFSYPDMQPILKHFSVYHLNAPGMEEGAATLKADFVYPTMDELAMAVLSVADHYGVKMFIGFGVGSGANVMARFALMHPTRVDSLVLINPTAARPGWIEWGYQKMNSWYLWSGQMTNFTEEYLLWHWFGQRTRWTNHDLVTVFKDYIKSINPQNLSLFIESYLKRTDLEIIRELDHIKKITVKSLKCRTMILVGDDSPHIEDVVNMNGRMDPESCDFMKIQDCGGMPLEEQPGKVCEAFRLFLQGMGYVPSLRAAKPINQSYAQTQPSVLNTANLSSQPVC